MNYREAARRYAKRKGIDPDLFERQIAKESGFNPKARSPAGATGIAQFMPGTAAGLGIDPNDPKQALEAAAGLMASYVKKYGNYEDALRAYNAGPGAIEKSKKYDETNKYVADIMGGAKSPNVTPTTGAPAATGSPKSNLFDVLRKLNANTGGEGGMAQSNWDLLARLQASRTPVATAANPTGLPQSTTTTGPTGPKSPGGAADIYELFHDPVGGWDRGKSIGPIGGHEHVHVAAEPRRVKWILNQAKKRFGLNVREHPDFDPVDPVHTEGSHHYKSEAGDVSGDPEKEKAFTNWIRRKYGLK